MAKSNMSGCSSKCIIYGLVAAALMAAGLVVIVSGFMMQWASSMTITQTLMSKIFLYYLGGFVLVAVGKMMKMKCCNFCSMA